MLSLATVGPINKNIIYLLCMTALVLSNSHSEQQLAGRKYRSLPTDSNQGPKHPALPAQKQPLVGAPSKLIDPVPEPPMAQGPNSPVIPVPQPTPLGTPTMATPPPHADLLSCLYQDQQRTIIFDCRMVGRLEIPRKEIHFYCTLLDETQTIPQGATLCLIDTFRDFILRTVSLRPSFGLELQFPVKINKEINYLAVFDQLLQLVSQYAFIPYIQLFITHGVDSPYSGEHSMCFSEQLRYFDHWILRANLNHSSLFDLNQHRSEVDKMRVSAIEINRDVISRENEIQELVDLTQFDFVRQIDIGVGSIGTLLLSHNYVPPIKNDQFVLDDETDTNRRLVKIIPDPRYVSYRDGDTIGVFIKHLIIYRLIKEPKSRLDLVFVNCQLIGNLDTVIQINGVESMASLDKPIVYRNPDDLHIIFYIHLDLVQYDDHYPGVIDSMVRKGYRFAHTAYGHSKGDLFYNVIPNCTRHKQLCQLIRDSRQFRTQVAASCILEEKFVKLDDITIRQLPLFECDLETHLNSPSTTTLDNPRHHHESPYLVYFIMALIAVGGSFLVGCILLITIHSAQNYGNYATSQGSSRIRMFANEPTIDSSTGSSVDPNKGSRIYSHVLKTSKSPRMASKSPPPSRMRSPSSSSARLHRKLLSPKGSRDR